MINPWVSDAVVIAAIGGVVSIITARITSQSKKSTENILGKLGKLSDNLVDVKSEVVEVKAIGLENRAGIRHTQRYRLFQEMTHDIERGYTTVSRVAEIGKLYGSYTSLDGNGEIHDLHEIFIKLPVKSDK